MFTYSSLAPESNCSYDIFGQYKCSRTHTRVQNNRLVKIQNSSETFADNDVCWDVVEDLDRKLVKQNTKIGVDHSIVTNKCEDSPSQRFFYNESDKTIRSGKDDSLCVEAVSGDHPLARKTYPDFYFTKDTGLLFLRKCSPNEKNQQWLMREDDSTFRKASASESCVDSEKQNKINVHVRTFTCLKDVNHQKWHS